MRRWGQSIISGVVAAVCGAAFAVMPVSTQLEESIGLWWLFKVRGAIAPPAEPVVVAIDGTTGPELNLPKLPRDWPRTMHAQLIERLVSGGAAVIVFDMDFSRIKEPEEDAAFARAIKQAGNVILYEPLIAKKQAIKASDGGDGGWTWIEKKLSPSPQLADAARARGPFPLPKLGRTAFEFWTFKPSAGNAPTIAAIALQLYALDAYEDWLTILERTGVPGLQQLPGSAAVAKSNDMGYLMTSLRNAVVSSIDLNDSLQLATDQAPQLPDGNRRILRALSALYAGPENRYLNFYGPPGTIARIPYQVLMRPELQFGVPQLPDLSGKVVFVGYSDLAEPEQPDRFYTVFTTEDGVDLSGVEIIATAFGNLMTDRSLQPSSALTTLSIALVFGFTVGAALYLLPAVIGIASGMAISGVYAAGAQWAFSNEDLWLPLVTPILVQLPTAVLVGLLGQYLVERRLEQRMSRAISYYLPESIVRDLTEKNLDPSKANKVVYGACLATDMSGFTAIAERKSPTELAAFMNTYFDAIADALKRHAVDITNFHADTIMCAWIGTEPNPAVRKKAILAALDVMNAIDEFAQRDASLSLNARIGLQDGQFYVGHTGGGGQGAYTILGDPANTASRLESLNKQLGTHVLAAQSVLDGISPEILTRPLGAFRLVGKADPIAVSEVMALRAEATGRQLELCRLFSQALDLLRARRWAGASALLERVLEQYEDDGPSRYYLRRCREFAADELHSDPTIILLDHK